MKDKVLKMLEGLLTEAGGGSMGARNRGVPGYPVPNEMRPQDHFQLTTDDDPVNEASGKKGIQHLEDLSPEEFLSFLKKYKDLPLEGGLEISEKVDGSARLTFGVEKGRLWVQSKNSPRRYSPNEWPHKPMFAAIHAAHEALESKSAQIKKWWDISGNDVVIGAEVLYTKIPNSIEYGPNVIMIHSVLGPGGVNSNMQSKKIALDLIKATGNTLTSSEGKWKFEYKHIIDPNDVLVDVKKEYDDLGAIYLDLKKIKKPTAEQLAQFKQIQHDVKTKLVAQLQNQQPAYGPEGGDVEGLVFRDLDNGNLVKLVDKEYFTALNKFLWFYRELLSRGVKVGEKWVPGIGQRLKNYIGDEVIGAPVAKTPGFVSYLKRHYGEPKNPQEIDVLLAKYIKDEKLMNGDFVSRFRAVIDKTRQEFLVVKKDWDQKKSGKISFTTPNGKTREMDDLIKKRTQDAFDEMEKALAGMETTVITIEKIKDEMTRKVALMKVMLGDNGLEKLSSHKGGEPAVEEQKINEASPPKKLSPDQAAKMAEVIQANAEKLKKRNIDISSAKPLGAGANGVAFDLGEHVLKITGDAAEANSSQVIKGKDFPNIVKIFDVFKFAETKYFGIYQEKLSPVPPTDKNEFTEFVTDLEVESGMFSKLWELGNWKDVVDNAIEGAREDDESSPESIARVRKELMVLQRKYQMDKIIMQLKAAKIKFRDFHGGNIMLRGKEHVLIDLGYSKSPKATVDVLERVEQAVIEGPDNLIDGAEETIKANKDKLVARGIQVTMVHELGSGAEGDVYQLNQKQVVKFTDSLVEAKNANHLKGKTEFKHLVHVYDVFRWPDEDEETRKTVQTIPMYGIVLELLKPLDSKRKEILDDFGLDYLSDLKGQNWDTYVKTSLEQLQNSGDEKYIPETEEALGVLKKIGIDKIVDDLAKAHIDYSDFHSGNVMTRGNDLVLVDFGIASSPGKEPSDKLENVILDSVISLLEGPPPIPVSQRKEPRSAGGSIIGIKPDKALEIIKQNAEKLAKKGVNAASAKAVGEGSRGTAFDVGQDRVLKITNDGKEAVAANKLKGLGLKHVSKIYDVWRFPGEGEVYGVLQEKLIPLNGQESQDLNYDLWSNKVWPKGYEIPPQINMAGYNWQKTRELVVQSVQDMAAKISDPKDQKNALVRANNSWKALNDTYRIGDMVTELSAKGIKFHDYHAGNIMKRGNGEYVVIDIGYSKVAGGKEPDVLEHIIERIAAGVPVDFNPVNHIDDGEVEKYGKMTEKTKADTVGVTIGRYQPFHKGHAEIIRKLAVRFTKVIIIVAGNKPDAKNPFSYDLRREIMDASLPDVEPKLEVYKAEIDGKPTGYLPGILNKIIVDHNSSLEADTAITIMVGEDRFTDVKKMLEHSKQNPTDGTYFNPELAVVEKLAGVKNDDDTDRISATRVRQAIAEGNKKAVMDMMDSHLMTNKDQLDVLFKKMREDMKKYMKVSEGLEENLSDVGGQSGMDNILHQNAAAIVKFKNLPANRAKPLGYGQMGVAYDLGDKVMKLTTDEDEAKASNLLKGKNKDHIVHVSDVFGLSSTKGSKTPVFAVIEEKLQEMTPEEKSEFNDLADYLRADETIEKVATGNYQAVLESIKELIWGDLKRELDLNDSATPEEKANNKRWKRATQLFTQRFQKVEQGLTKFQFDKMIAELRSLNIQFADYHSGNVMKRGATYVINDLGKSKSPGQDPPFLESLVRDISDAISENGMPGMGTATDFGGTTTRLRAGSSGWSAPSHNMTQDDVEDGDRDLQWQEMIPDPNLKMRP